MKENPSQYYITTPIYYVNDLPHIGHAYTTVLADVMAGYRRLLGVPVRFLTGTDEHGQKVQRAAEAAGITPQEQCDRTVTRFQELWKHLGITYDDFIRTTEPRHTAVVQKTLQELFERDEIYRAEYEGWYCIGCERFFTGKDLDGEHCPECSRPVEEITESNYFFRMSKYQDWLIRYIKTHPSFILPAFRANETLGFLKNNALQDLCISRPKSRLNWGIELPFDPAFVTYVWFDALINYVSAIGYRSNNEQFQKWWPCSCHLIGKDILTTHTVYWPTMLKAMGLKMPRSIFAHGWWLTGRAKMSKSLGNVVDPMEMIDRCGADAFRYFLIAEMALGQDAVFTEEAFFKRYHADLVNNLGNLVHRILNMISRYCDGKIPDVPQGAAPNTTLEGMLWRDMTDAAETTQTAINEMRLDGAVSTIMDAVRRINAFIQHRAPWRLAQKEETAAQVEQCLYTAAECLRVCSALLYPVMPGKMAALRLLLGMGNAPPRLERLTEFGVLPSGLKISQSGVLFKRIRTEKKKGEPSKGPENRGKK